MFPLVVFSKPAITYDLTSGRLGDQLIYYCKAKDLSKKHNLIFYYRPFKYSSLLCLSKQDRVLKPSVLKQYKIVKIGQLLDVNQIDYEKNILYVVSSQHYIDANDDKLWYGINDDDQFRNDLKAGIKSQKKLNLISPRAGMISVAIHYRSGGGYDSNEVMLSAPEKFPDFSFHLGGLKEICKLFSDKPLYVFLFTDHTRPLSLLKKFESNCSHEEIYFDCRRYGNSHSENVLEDLFSMSLFDCLIRPWSGFSVIAQVIGNFRYVVYPEGKNKIGFYQKK